MVAFISAFRSATRKDAKTVSLYSKKKSKEETLDWDLKVYKVAKPTLNIVDKVNLSDKDPKNFHYIYALIKN